MKKIMKIGLPLIFGSMVFDKIGKGTPINDTAQSALGIASMGMLFEATNDLTKKKKGFL